MKQIYNSHIFLTVQTRNVRFIPENTNNKKNIKNYTLNHSS